MDDEILQSVIELTQQHDVDSLEVTLISTMADLVPANAIFLVKPSAETNTGDFMEEMRLSISTNADCKHKYKWVCENNIYTGSTVMQECFNNKKPVLHHIEHELQLFLIPIIRNDNTSAVLGIESYQDLSSWHHIIEAFIKIYGNYLTILRISERDKLTDLNNRRTFDIKLEKLLVAQRLQYEQSGKSPSINEKRRIYPEAYSWLAMVDIDHFKRINDTFGHLFGDEVILNVSQQMKRFFRRSDLLFRFGGEEFIIILAPQPREITSQTLDRFRMAIARHKIPQVGEVTISIGYTKIIDGVSSHIILDHADKALYYAKEHGRNCIYNYEELIETGSLSEQKKSSVTLFIDDAHDMK